MLKLKELSDRQLDILNLLSDGEWHPATSLIDALVSASSPASLKRDLKGLLEDQWIEQFGKARATKYRRSRAAQILFPIGVERYFSRPQDDRAKAILFNWDIFSQLESLKIFKLSEKQKLARLQIEFQKNIRTLSSALIKREFERVTIDLSWKSSVIEGNTYTLLETEALLKDGVPAPGKSSEDATMLLNHKVALDFVRKNVQEFKVLTKSNIESVHSILSKDLDISRNVRKRIVGITGTNYRPIDNEFQINEALEKTCNTINKCDDVFTKTLLAILLISYIQPFEDGNKRTARLIGNAILLSHDCFPLSFRSVDVNQYKKAILLFYEINNLYELKSLFLEQAQFSVSEYFR
jgi:Fic family protein